MQATVPITGNTYPVREQLKSLGGRWNAAKKVWELPESSAEEARKLVAAQPKKKSRGAICPECGRPGASVRDLEDGILKHYRCCDMPPSGY